MNPRPALLAVQPPQVWAPPNMPAGLEQAAVPAVTTAAAADPRLELGQMEPLRPIKTVLLRHQAAVTAALVDPAHLATAQAAQLRAAVVAVPTEAAARLNIPAVMVPTARS